MADLTANGNRVVYLDHDHRLKPDYHEAERFLRLLDSSTDQFTFQTFDDAVLPDGKKRDSKDPLRVIHGTLAECFLDLLKLNVDKRAGIFVTVNATDGKGRKEGNITRTRSVWADLDRGATAQPPLSPSIVVSTSPGKWQTYWLCDGLTAEQHRGVNEHIAQAYGADPNTVDLPRVLRLPGFYHRKGAPHMVRLVPGLTSGKRFTAGEVLAAFPPTERPAAAAGAPAWVDPARVNDALNHIKADDRAVWLRVGMALHHQYGEQGFGPWCKWSQTASHKYNGADQLDTWGSLKRERTGKDVTIATLFHLAEQNGWRNYSTALESNRDILEAPKDQQPGAVIRATPYQWADPAAIPPREWLYGRHLIRKFVTATVAPGGLGKSSLLAVEALSIVTGRDLLGYGHAPDPGRVWWWNGEDPYDELQRRIQALCLRYGISEDDIGGRLFIDSGRAMPIVLATQDRTGTRIAVPAADQIKATLVENAIDALYIDPFVSSHRVTENDNNAIDAVVKEWGRITEAFNGAIDLVHHARKTGGEELTTEDSRGGQALHDGTRAMRLLNRMTEAEGKAAGVDDHKLYFRVDAGSNRMTPPARVASWYRLHSVDLGNATAKRPSDKIGVVVPWEWPDPHAGLAPDALQKAQAATAEGEWREDIRAKAWIGKPIAEALGIDLSDPAGKERVKALLKDWRKRGAFVEYEGQDAKRETCLLLKPIDGFDIKGAAPGDFFKQES
jgi:hypothetical protein